MNRTRIASTSKRNASRKRLCDSFTPVGLSTSVDLIHRGPPFRNEKLRSVPDSLMLSAERSHSDNAHHDSCRRRERITGGRGNVFVFGGAWPREEDRDRVPEPTCSSCEFSFRPLAWSIRHVPYRPDGDGHRKHHKWRCGGVRFAPKTQRPSFPFIFFGDGSLGGVLVAIGNSDRSIGV
jgi:hypothetical protein